MKYADTLKVSIPRCLISNGFVYMRIVGYLKTSFIEWPGKIAAVLFTPGCNFRCPFCHNSDLVDPAKMAKLSTLKETEILADLKKRKKWIDGVVITGGEPTLQSDLASFLAKLKKLGFKTMIETNGSNPSVIRNLIIRKLVNFIAMDYKTTFSEYENVVKNKNQKSKIKKTMKLILESGLPFEFRTTVVPGIHSEQVLPEMARELRNLNSELLTLHSDLNWFLQSFRPKNCLEKKFNQIKPFTQEEMDKFLRSIQKIIKSVKLR